MNKGREIFFEGRVAILATMHHKEQVIAPILQQDLGIQVQVAALNTDQFGTFTREIARTGSQLAAARQKINAAIALTQQPLALASEGSFGPHPALLYLPCNREVVVLADRNHDLEVVGQAVSTTTNFSSSLVTDFEAAQAFAQKAGFPEHGLVVSSDGNAPAIAKGIHTEAELSEIVKWTLATFGQAWLETDMRALHNPTRMQVIAEATRDLVRQLNSRCPECAYPGFDVIEYQKGLPCEYCGVPTDLPLTAVYRCQHCNFTQSVRFPEGKQTANPAQCSRCNP